jgi:hypothetical protein
MLSPVGSCPFFPLVIFPSDIDSISLCSFAMSEFVAWMFHRSFDGYDIETFPCQCFVRPINIAAGVPRTTLTQFGVVAIALHLHAAWLGVSPASRQPLQHCSSFIA